MKTAPQPPVGKPNPILPLVEKIETFLRQAHAGGLPAHEVEQVVWQEILLIGHRLLQQFFDLHGSADAGETWTMPDGREVRRLKEPHAKIYQSVFGTFHLNRTVYAAREGQRIEFAPLDARLALPAGEYSYLLQDWAQTLAVEVSFAQAGEILRRMLGCTVPVDSLERMNRRMAEDVAVFRESLPPPPPDEEGAILVTTADNKGVPMRRPADEIPVGARRKKGEKANKKRMATLACVYTVDPKPRSAGDVIEALFRERSPARSGEEEKAPEVKARSKRVMACLEPVGCEGEGASPQAEGFNWAGAEAASRWRDGMSVVCVMDGQVSLWNLAREKLGELKPVEILDLLHVVSRVWEAAYLFHAEGSPEAVRFVRQRLERLLEGKAGYVIGGMRQMGTRQGLSGAKLKKLGTITNYLENNIERMRYDKYLADGYPIASGVIEGACRHVVKDRMERSGMRWSMEGAQSMLDLRTTYINGQWEEYQEYHIEQETARRYPQRAQMPLPESNIEMMVA